ncbi:hypothetical protein BDZ88DRAFT_31957 [Geranomyces variabilis]|nr:hypothetical protein BDZ88DRAFT_31957 [Geranomyces variabilis]
MIFWSPPQCARRRTMHSGSSRVLGLCLAIPPLPTMSKPFRPQLPTLAALSALAVTPREWRNFKGPCTTSCRPLCRMSIGSNHVYATNKKFHVPFLFKGPIYKFLHGTKKEAMKYGDEVSGRISVVFSLGRSQPLVEPGDRPFFLVDEAPNVPPASGFVNLAHVTNAIAQAIERMDGDTILARLRSVQRRALPDFHHTVLDGLAARGRLRPRI